MLRVVLPAIATGPTAPIPVPASRLVRYAVAAVNVVAIPTVDIGVAIEIVVVVDGHVVVSTPTAAVSPASTPRRSHCQTDTERNRHTCRIVTGRRIVDRWIWIDRRTVHDGRIVAWDVNNFRIGLFDNNHLFGFHNLGFYLLLLGRFQVAGVAGLFPHALNGIHDLALLRQKCIAEVRGPLDVIRQTLDHVGKRSQPLNARVPGLFRDRIHERLVLQVLVLRQPLLELDKL
jgi:hypothetical protein